MPLPAYLKPVKMDLEAWAWAVQNGSFKTPYACTWKPTWRQFRYPSKMDLERGGGLGLALAKWHLRNRVKTAASKPRKDGPGGLLEALNGLGEFRQACQCTWPWLRLPRTKNAMASVNWKTWRHRAKTAKQQFRNLLKMDLEACLEACAWVPQDENCHMAVSKPFKDGLGGKTAASKPAGCTQRLEGVLGGLGLGCQRT